MNAALILAYVIDNDIVDGPEIQCTDQSVRFTFRAKNPFRSVSVTSAELYLYLWHVSEEMSLFVDSSACLNVERNSTTMIM